MKKRQSGAQAGRIQNGDRKTGEIDEREVKTGAVSEESGRKV